MPDPAGKLQKRALARASKVLKRLAGQDQLSGEDAKVWEARRQWALEYVAELAARVGGGVCGAAPIACVEQAAIAGAWCAKWNEWACEALAKGDRATAMKYADLALRHGDAMRVQLISAHQLAARQATKDAPDPLPPLPPLPADAFPEPEEQKP